MSHNNLIKFDVTLPNGSVRHVKAECERDCVDWFESFNLKPTLVMAVSNPGRWVEYVEIPSSVSAVPSTIKPTDDRKYQLFGKRVAEIIQSAGEDWGSDELGEIANAAIECGIKISTQNDGVK